MNSVEFNQDNSERDDDVNVFQEEDNESNDEEASDDELEGWFYNKEGNQEKTTKFYSILLRKSRGKLSHLHPMLLPGFGRTVGITISFIQILRRMGHFCTQESRTGDFFLQKKLFTLMWTKSSPN